MNFFDWLINAPDNIHLGRLTRAIAIFVVILGGIACIETVVLTFAWILITKQFQYLLIPFLASLVYLYHKYRCDVKGLK